MAGARVWGRWLRRKLLGWGLALLLGAALLVGAAALYWGVPSLAPSLARGALANFNNNFSGQVEVQEIDFQWSGLRLGGIRLKLDGGERLAEIEALTLQFHWGRALRRCDYMALGGDLRLEGVELYPELDAHGQLNFAQLRMLTPKKEERWPWEEYLSRYEGRLLLEDGSAFFRDFSRGQFCAQVEDLDLELRLEPQQPARWRLAFTPLQAVNSWEPEEGRIALEGWLALDPRPDFNVQLNLRHLNLARLADYWGELPGGARLWGAQLEAELWARGRAPSWLALWERLNYGGQIRLREGKVRLPKLQAPVQNISLEVDLFTGLAHLRRLQADIVGAQAQAQGKLYVWPPSPQEDHWSGRLELGAQLPKLSLASLSKALGLKVPLEGSLDTEVALEGNLKSPQAKGKLSSARVRLAEQELRNLEVAFNFKDRLLNIERLRAQAVGGQVEGDGYLLLEGSEPQLVFNLRGQELSLAGLSPVGGRVNNFQLSLVGTPKDPFLYGRGEVDSFSGPASLLERASAHFIATDSYLSLNGVQAQTGWGSARVPYANYDFRQPFLYAWMEADNFSLPPIRLANFGTLQGDFSGQAQVVGSPLDLNSLNLWGYSRSTNLRLGHLRIEGLRGLVGMNGFNLYFPSMYGYAAGGRVAASGWLGLKGGSSSLSLDAQGVALEPFIQVLPYNIPLAFPGKGRMGASWNTLGRGEDNWLRLYLQGKRPGIVANAQRTPVVQALEGISSSAWGLWEEVHPLRAGEESSDPQPQPTPLALGAGEELLALGPSSAEAVRSGEAAAEEVQANPGWVGPTLEGAPWEEDSPPAEEGVEAETPLGESVRQVWEEVQAIAAPPQPPYLPAPTYATAIEGFIGPRGVGLVGWAQDLSLDGRILMKDLPLAGEVSGRFGAWGPVKDLNFTYLAAVAGPPLADIADHTLWAAGQGHFSPGQIKLYDNILAWEYLPPSGWRDWPHWEGRAYQFLGPELAPPLVSGAALPSPFPESGYLKVEGRVGLNKPWTYRLKTQLSDIELGWLQKQAWLSPVAKLMANSNIRHGRAQGVAYISSEAGFPKVEAGSWLETPWFVAGQADNLHSFSGIGAFRSGVQLQGPQGKPSLGTIYLDRVLVANRSLDRRLPQGRAIFEQAAHLVPVEPGMMEVSGTVAGGKVDLETSFSEWRARQALAFANNPNLNPHLVEGSLSSPHLSLELDLQEGLWESLNVDGRLDLRRGYLQLANRLWPLDELGVSIRRDGERLFFSDLLLKAGGVTFQGQGWRDRHKHWQADLYADAISFEELATYEPVFSDLRGQAQLALHIESDDPALRAIQTIFALEGKDVVWNSLPVSLALPDFRMGRILQDEEGRPYTDLDAGLSLDYHSGRVFLDIPPQALAFSAYRFIEKELLPPHLRQRLEAQYEAQQGEAAQQASATPPEEGAQGSAPPPRLALDSEGRLLGVRLDAKPTLFQMSGGLDFSPNLNSDFKEWFTGPNGPNFGVGSEPLTLSLDNFQANIARAALGLPMDQRQFTFSGSLGLKGQWYYGHLRHSAPGSLEYDFAIHDLAFGSLTLDQESQLGSKLAAAPKQEGEPHQPPRLTWRGLTLKEEMRGSYRREERTGRLIIEPFEFVPLTHKLGTKWDDKNLEAEGTISGSANLALTSLRRPRRSLEGQPPTPPQPRSAGSNPELNELYLNVSKVPISELGSFLFPGLESGFVEDLVLNASGPLHSPLFNLVFNITSGKAGKLDLASITGAVSGSRDPQSHEYQVRLGTINSSLPLPRLDEVVNRGLEDIISQNPQDYAQGVQVYFGKERRPDRVFSLAGTLPYETSVTRAEEESLSLVPFWEGVQASLEGRLNLEAQLKDKDLSILSSVVPDIKRSGGDMVGSLQVGGTLFHPEVVGDLRILKGSFEHAKLGSISDINFEANFSELQDRELRRQYTRQKRHTELVRHGIGSILARRWGLKFAPGADSENIGPRLPQEDEENFNRITLRSMSGLWGDKPFTASGQADMDGFQPLAVDFNFQGKQLPVQWGDLFKGQADIDLHLSKAPTTPEVVEGKMPKLYYLSGKVDVSSGDLSVALDTLTSSGGQAFDWSQLPLDYRVDLHIGEDVWMHAFGCRVRTAGQLAILPQEGTGKPVLEGEVDLSRGVLAVPLYDVSFKVRSGRAVFNKSQMPTLENVQADASVDNYEVTAYVSGSYPDLQLEFISNPPLSQQEIQRLLALGSYSNYNPTGNPMTNEPGNTTGVFAVSTDLDLGTSGLTMLSRMIASPLTKEISRLLFLSDFSLDVTSPHGYTFKVAKSLDSKDRFLFTLTHSLDTRSGEDESAYGIEWRFLPNMSIRIGFDQYGDFNPWFQGSWQY